MTEKNEARVEVLTAEVRALMVGRRQVTLSVFRQLDRAEPKEIEPFGRVRDKGDEVNAIDVVGRHIMTGSLVRSRCYQVTRRTVIRPSQGWALVGGECATREVIVRERDGAVILADLITGRPASRYDHETPVDGWRYADGGREYVERMADERLAMVLQWLPAYEAWSTLPLIVLAGLR